MPTLAPLTPLDLNVQIPHHFRCPISLELMRDPVILSTGHTYDRSSIEKWVAVGNTTCPVTMQKLEDFTLIPNHTLRRLIQEWCVANRSRGVERIPTPKQPADPSRVRSLLVEAASTGTENGPARAFAIRALKNLAKEGDKNRSLMVDAGAVSVLINALFGDLDEAAEEEGVFVGDSRSEASEEPRGIKAARDAGEAGRANGDVVEEALAALVLLPLNDSERLSIMQPQRLAFISSLLRWGRNMEARANAGALVEILSDSKEYQELRVVLAGTPGIMTGLVKLLREPAHSRGVKVGIKALFSLCLRTQGKEQAVAAGAATALIERLLDVEKNDAERVLGTIELLCTTEAGCTAVASHSLAVAVLVKFILKVSDRATEYAAGSLHAICFSSEKVRKDAVQAGVFKELLLLMQSDCTGRAKTKAMNLLKLLQGNLLNNSCMPEYGRTDVVPF